MRRVVEAVPGAGKTRLLVTLTHERPSLLLAYNKQLASAIAEKVDADSLCITFHALCSRCLETARDDVELALALDRAERGELLAVDVPTHRRVLIDEAQDVRELYVRLLRVLGLTSAQHDIVVVGDPMQLVYDFDDAYPATLRTLQAPEEVFGGAFARERLTRSHRLTAPMVALANAVFDTRIETARAGARVDVRAPRNMFSSLYECLRDVLATQHVLLLVDRKNANRALRTLLNRISRAGHAVRVHGIDEEDAADERLECGTFWSAKGLQRETVVVLLPGRAARNPTYVALTRALERLVLVLDPKDPHPLVCKAIVAEPQHYSILDRHTRDVVGRGYEADGARALERRELPTAGFACLDRATPSPGSYFASFARADVVPPTRARPEVAVRLALVAAEHAATGHVRAMEDVLSPSRLEFGALNEAIRLGFSSRAVPQFVSDDELLAPDLRALAVRSYRRMDSLADAATVALATLAWDSWDHVMRAALPIDWLDGLDEAIAFVRAALPADAVFDVRLVGAGGHARAHAVGADAAYHVCWDASASEMALASVRAALHPQGACVLVDAGARRVGTVYATSEL